jgi:long-chain acyl-CoA synthetase
MELRSLVPSLPGKKRAIYTLERGKPVRHPYSVLFNDVVDAREKLRGWGVRAGTRVGIYAPNSYHWLVYDLALIDMGAVSVALTDDFAGKIDDELLARYGVALLLTSKSNAHIFSGKSYIAFMDADNGAVSLIDAASEADPDALSLAFSSGSAGGLKGLVISRDGVESTLPPIVEAIGVTEDDRLLLFLPMSNFQQRMMSYSGLAFDFDIIIADYAQLFTALSVLHPTILIAPPMYFQMVHTRFVNFPRWKQSLWAVLAALIALVPGAQTRRALARRTFAEFHRQFGSNMRVLITGMAPIKRSIGAFFESMQLPLSESYGLVETGSLTYRPPGSRKYGSVGRPVEGVKIDLADDGEVIVRRERSLTKKYFQCVDGENERTFVAPGSIATGDIGKLDGEGYLYLLGRKKELIVTPGGYKIHPEIIEEELNSCPDIAQSVVFSKRGSPHLVCVVALNQHDAGDAPSRVKKFVAEMSSIKKAAPIGEIIFSDGPFSTENGMLRPNLKVDRRNIAAKYDL